MYTNEYRRDSNEYQRSIIPSVDIHDCRSDKLKYISNLTDGENKIRINNIKINIFYSCSLMLMIDNSTLLPNILAVNNTFI